MKSKGHTRNKVTVMKVRKTFTIFYERQEVLVTKVPEIASKCAADIRKSPSLRFCYNPVLGDLDNRQT